MNSLFLYSLNLQGFELLVEDLAKIHDNTLVNLLPQMGTEYLNQTDLESGDFTVHEDTRQIQLHLETDVDVCSIDRRTPPECETTIRDLVKTGTLGIREFLVSHRLFETGCLLPEKTLPSGEVRSLEQSMLEDTLYTTKGRNDINTVVVELPEFTVMAL